MKPDQEYLIALGGNLPSSAGPPGATLRATLETLTEAGAGVLSVSRFFRTPCSPPGAGPDYVNAAAHLRYRGTPEAVLAMLHEVETEFGRERVQRWGRRTLDLDLIAAGDTILPDAATQARWRRLPPAEQTREAPGRLILPHPRLQERAFVLVPLAEVAPDWLHPVLGLTVSQMLAALPRADRDAAVPL